MHASAAIECFGAVLVGPASKRNAPARASDIVHRPMRPTERNAPRAGLIFVPCRWVPRPVILIAIVLD